MKIDTLGGVSWNMCVLTDAYPSLEAGTLAFLGARGRCYVPATGIFLLLTHCFHYMHDTLVHSKWGFIGQ
jgi:hypothetical protein